MWYSLTLLSLSLSLSFSLSLSLSLSGQDGQWSQFNQLHHAASQLSVPLILRQHTWRRESPQRASLLHTGF